MPKPFDQDTVESPCVRICCLDEADICLGCGRTLTEITAWSSSTRETRLAVKARARQRLGLPPEHTQQQ